VRIAHVEDALNICFFLVGHDFSWNSSDADAQTILLGMSPSVFLLFAFVGCHVEALKGHDEEMRQYVIPEEASTYVSAFFKNLIQGAIINDLKKRLYTAIKEDPIGVATSVADAVMHVKNKVGNEKIEKDEKNLFRNKARLEEDYRGQKNF